MILRELSPFERGHWIRDGGSPVFPLIGEIKHLSVALDFREPFVIKPVEFFFGSAALTFFNVEGKEILLGETRTSSSILKA